ncbi:MAG: hypothetical protein IPK00_06225 [Deltaproteobacteria bacterium]|nr:hypothetical protein [Deltaproteobacteria bacterium]
MTTTTRDASSGWLYGPIPDLLLGCGVLFLLVAGAFSVAGGALFRAVPPYVPELVIALVSAPHYGATLVRVYEQRADRRGYFFFSVVATSALLLLFGVALVAPIVASVLATVYLTWAGWHYTGQNYGIAAMFLRRRGVPFDDTARRLLHASFVLSFLFVLFVAHAQLEAIADPGREARFIPLAIPQSVNGAVLPVLLVAYAATTLGWIGLLARRAERLADLGPTLLLAGVQLVWWSVPYLGRFYGFGEGNVAIDWNARTLFFPWVAGAHAIQYLWITTYYARSSGPWHGQGRYYASILIAGLAVWTIPPLLFAPGVGEFDWNFALLLAATVNIHHFVLDGAIWKLRQPKIARVLIASEPAGAVAASTERTLLRRAVWAIAILGPLLTVQYFVDQYVIEPRSWQAGDAEAVERSLARQSWLGRTTAYDYFRLGRLLETSGQPDAAVIQLERSAAMEPRVESIKRVIAHALQSGDRARFIHACDQLFELDQVERPLPTIDLGLATRAEFLAFQEACVRVAQATRPVSPRASATGGAGQDGRVAAPEGYR